MAQNSPKPKDEYIIEVAHLILSESDPYQEMKYIIAHKKGEPIFKFCADFRHDAHQHIFKQAVYDGELPKDHRPIGGGYMSFQKGSQPPTVKLEDMSMRFGREPDDVRAMALPIVRARLQQLGIEVQ